MLARQPLAGVGLQVHGGIHQQLAALVVVGNLAYRLTEDIQKSRCNVERLACVAILAGFVQPSPAHFVVAERLRAVLHQTIGPHVVVGADHQPAQRVHQRVVAISAVAGAEEVLDQRLQPLVAQPAVQIREELLFLARADVIQIVMRFRLLQQREVLLLVGRRGVVEYDDLGRVPVTPEMFVVLLNRLADVTQTVCRDCER